MPDQTDDHFATHQPGSTSGGSAQLLLEGELAVRWRVSPRTLQSWRWKGRGPTYLRVCGRVLYRIEDVVEFEVNSVRRGTR